MSEHKKRVIKGYKYNYKYKSKKFKKNHFCITDEIKEISKNPKRYTLSQKLDALNGIFSTID